MCFFIKYLLLHILFLAYNFCIYIYMALHFSYYIYINDLLIMNVICNGLFQKKTEQGRGRGGGGEGPGVFRFFTLHLEIPDKTRLHPQKLHQIVLHPSKILRPKTKTPRIGMNLVFETLDSGRKWLIDFSAGKTQLVSFD